MKIDIKVPEVGESVQEAVLAQWYKHDGDMVHKDEVLFVLETDKITLEVTAEADGTLEILAQEEETVAIGAVVGRIATAAEATTDEGEESPEKEKAVDEAAAKEDRVEPQPQAEPEPKPSEKPGEEPEREEEPQPAEAAEVEPPREERKDEKLRLAPAARRLVQEQGLDVAKLSGTGPDGLITKGDVVLYLEKSTAQGVPERSPKKAAPASSPESGREPPSRAAESESAQEEAITRKPMSPIRRRIAQRLLEAKQNTAMLTTFNEIDMSRLQEARARFKAAFKEKYGVSLGMMSFFIKACVAALQDFPQVNAFIDGQDMVYHHYCHIGVAIGAERGLVVPVIRHADRRSFAELEQAIVNFVKKIKANRLELADLEGGTFTVSNGGVYGSLLSTPILNAPQSAILGMHKIEDRPVVVDGEIVVRPMMYVALSYDHRIVDGREAVSFLKRIKECVENPERIMLEI